MGGNVPVFNAGDYNYMFTDEFLRQGGVWMKEQPVRISDDIPGLYSVKTANCCNAFSESHHEVLKCAKTV